MSGVLIFFLSLFRALGVQIDLKDVGGHLYWELGDWFSVLEGTGMFEDASFLREEATLSFYLAKFEVIDYVDHVDRWRHCWLPCATR